MDKKKTGNLIKEARMKKNYTQSELGDLLCVSNKAVSRWENGDSFPDIGVLENLSAILGLRIQDIVTGEVESNDESVLTEVVRVSRLQQLEKQSKLWKYGLIWLFFLCCLVAGYACFGGGAGLLLDGMRLYFPIMVISFAVSVVGNVMQSDGEEIDADKFSKRMRFWSIIALAWSVIVTWMFTLSILNGHIPFGMNLSSVGPVINGQLRLIFIAGIVMLGIELYRNEKKDVAMHWGYMVWVATIHLTVLYSDLLYRLENLDRMIHILAVRTLIVFVAFAISVLITKLFTEKKKNQGRGK